MAHECIIDIRPLKEASGISEEDIPKPATNRVDNVYGDRHFICSCPDIDSYVE